MARVVMKFGGTSVADPDRIRRCATRVADRRAEGHQVAVVVSAMGHTTDELIALARRLSPAPNRRELDMLMATGEQVSVALMAIALQEMGLDAESYTGDQAGIVTDGHHGRAKITTIDRTPLEGCLAKGSIPIVAGFQGRSVRDQITTLGRGGSDTTAVAVAAAVEVGRLGGHCEIFTDVDGVYTADPRVVRNARKLERISYEEMLELAALGAGVMHARAVVFGERYGVPIHVRHSQKPDQGTIICKETPDMEEIAVVGCALKEELGRLTIRRVPNTVGLQAQIFERVAAAGIVVDDIVQTEFGDMTSLAFTVDQDDLAETKDIMARLLMDIGHGELGIDVGLSKVSAVGTGMKSHAGIASRMFQALARNGIAIHNISTSEIKVSCIAPGRPR
jgi:aspartate kinase